MRTSYTRHLSYMYNASIGWFRQACLQTRQASVRQPDQHLAAVDAVEKPDQGGRGVVDPFEDGLLVLHLAGLQPVRHFGAELVVEVHEVRGHEAADVDP